MYMLNKRKSNLESSIMITFVNVYNATLFSLCNFLWSGELFFQNGEILVFFLVFAVVKFQKN
jgi:hypothetical protein